MRTRWQASPDRVVLGTTWCVSALATAFAAYRPRRGTERASQLVAMPDSAPTTKHPSGAYRLRPGGVALVTALIFAALIVGIALGNHWSSLRGVTASQAPSTSMPGMPGMEASPLAAPAGASSSAVYVSPARQQLIGVRTGVVERQHLDAVVRTVGVLAYDETRVTHVHTKVAGWIDRVFVDFVGKRVQRGQPLFSVYSPDLVTAQTDYLVALRARDQLFATSPESRDASDALLTAARQRLQRWDVSDAEIAALERTRQASKTVVFASPFDGIVLERNAIAGQYLTPDMSAFKVGDISTVWVLGQLFEYEASRIRPGEPVDIEFPYGQSPGTLSARVDFVYPDIDPQTRRVRFRASLPNADGRLKPDTYVTLVLHGEPMDRLVVPAPAIIDTGARTYALLALPNGYFDPRDVAVGPQRGDYYPVVSGLSEGDRVVTSAQFLIDSETNLMAAMQNMAASMPGMDMPANTGKASASPALSASSTAMPPMPGMPPAPPHAPTTTAMPTTAMPPMPGMPAAPTPVPSHAHPTPPPAPAPPTSSPPPAPAQPAPTPSPAVPARPAMPAMPGMPGMDMPMPSGAPAPEHHHGGGP
jgi:RND family efflux transporter MFP subunit